MRACGGRLQATCMNATQGNAVLQRPPVARPHGERTVHGHERRGRGNDAPQHTSLAPKDRITMATAHSTSQGPKYAQTIRAGTHTIIADEGAALGGADAGMAPYQLLLSALAACTAITL